MRRKSRRRNTANCTVSATFAPLPAPLAGVCGSAHNPAAAPLLTAAPAANLCAAGTPSGITSGTSTWGWTCAASTTATCQAPRGYTVTPSAGAGGSISPSTAQTVAYHATPAFTVTPAGTHEVDTVTGCGGSLAGNTFTSGPVTANCTVSATFAPLPAPANLTLPEGPHQGLPLTLAAQPTNGWQLAQAGTQTVASLNAPALPAGVTLPHGVVSLRLVNGTAGSEATVVLTYPQSVQGMAYYKYSPATGWYVYPRAQISGNTVTLRLVDNGAGDTDLTPSVIQDPGGPGVGPGGANAIPTLNQWALMLLAGLFRLGGGAQASLKTGLFRP